MDDDKRPVAAIAATAGAAARRPVAPGGGERDRGRQREPAIVFGPLPV